MRRPSLPLIASCLLLAAAHPTHASVIDSFESGPFSITRSSPGSFHTITTPSPGHCVSATRSVTMAYEDGPGVMTAELLPLQNTDDALHLTFPQVYGRLALNYSNGGPWDLTESGTFDRIAVRALGQPVSFRMWLTDTSDNKGGVQTGLNSATHYFPFASFQGVDPTQVKLITIFLEGGNGSTINIYDISTTNYALAGITYAVHTPATFTYLCSARGANTLGWDWGLAWPSAPSLAGPQLTVTGISGSNCQGVSFNADDSGPGGNPGEMGLINVDWQAATFDDAAFEMYFVTDPNASYVAQMVGDPVVTMYASAFTIGHDIQVSDLLGIPDGVIHQDLVVSAAPGQELYFDYVEALPYFTGAGVGYSLSFGITGAVVDPGNPLLEMYTTASYSDDAGATGVGVTRSEDALDGLAAHPSVTRTSTRFVLPGETTGREVVEVFDVTGRRVRRLETSQGEATWNATDEQGARVPAGVYFARAAGVGGTARVVLLR